MSSPRMWEVGGWSQLAPSASEAKAYDIHRDVIVGTRLMRTVWPTAAYIDFAPSHTPDTGRVSFEGLFDDQGRTLLDERGLSDLCNLAAQREPGREGDDRAVGVEAVFGLRRAVSSWRAAKVLRIPAGATWEVRVGEIRDGSGVWTQSLVQLVLPAQDQMDRPEAPCAALGPRPGTDAVGRPL